MVCYATSGNAQLLVYLLPTDWSTQIDEATSSILFLHRENGLARFVPHPASEHRRASSQGNEGAPHLKPRVNLDQYVKGT